MAQFLQKSILPRKQSIINEIYQMSNLIYSLIFLIELQKFQNLVSIVGDGNIKLAKVMAKDGMIEANK
jgi:hypothetical protein